MKKNIISPLLLALFFLFILGCDPVDTGDYETLTIGTQVWMKNNMNIEAGNSWCYDDELANCSNYGRLYDWETALTVCPSGWHLPSDDEWTKLTDYLGGEEVAAGKMKSTGTIEAGTGLWYDPNRGATNASGWSGLPGGYRGNNGVFEGLGRGGGWWSTYEGDADHAWYRGMYYTSGCMYREYGVRGYGFAVRCIRN